MIDLDAGVLIACDRDAVISVAEAVSSTHATAFSFVKTRALPVLPPPTIDGGPVLELLRSLGPAADAIDDATPRPTRPASPVSEAADTRIDVSIVIPVYGALDEVDRCVRSVIASLEDASTEVLIVNDGSPGADAVGRLEALAALDRRVRLMTRQDNRGYTATVNEGSRAAPRDVILLNSDTEVPPGWIGRLRAVAYSRPDVATVTPVSNAAGPFSVPGENVNEDLPNGIDTATMDALVRRASRRRRPTAPTGNGFCMYIRRDAFDALGYFDEFAFPRGYGEENDFCMRATAVGRCNLVDDSTFVYHQRSASFGDSKVEILKTSRAVLDEIHPTYTVDVRRWLKLDVLGGLRSDLRSLLDGGRGSVEEALLSAPTILFMLHAGGGGTPQTNADLMGSLAGRFRPLLLRCGVQEWNLVDHEERVIRTWTFSTRWEARGGLEQEREKALLEAIALSDASVVHVRSLIASGPEYLGVIKATKRPVILSFHDFAAVCPTIQLLDEKQRYCAGECTSGAGKCGLALFWFERAWDDLKHEYVHEWRRRMAEGFDHVDEFVTTSQAAREVLVNHFASIAPRLRVIDHGRDTGLYERVGVEPQKDAVQRVVCFGALGAAKGIDLIEAVMKIDQQRDVPRFEFHFVGQLHGRWHPEQWGGVVHGPYERSNLGSILESIGPNYALIASLWPETYCHTLTEAWACGLPVFSSNIGTLRERVLANNGGWLLDQTNPDAWYRGMCAAANDPGEWRKKSDGIARSAPRTVDAMALEYDQMYGSVLGGVVARSPAGVTA